MSVICEKRIQIQKGDKQENEAQVEVIEIVYCFCVLITDGMERLDETQVHHETLYKLTSFSCTALVETLKY